MLLWPAVPWTLCLSHFEPNEFPLGTKAAPSEVLSLNRKGVGVMTIGGVAKIIIHFFHAICHNDIFLSDSLAPIGVIDVGQHPLFDLGEEGCAELVLISPVAISANAHAHQAISENAGKL